MSVLLPDAVWRERVGLDTLLLVLDVQSGRTRFVGGAVRDTLLGLPVHDIDLATQLTPDDVLKRLAEAQIKAVPTGLAHGTITAVLPDGPIEITTLRRDVATDGRHATIAYTNDWQEDAARRDFKINALSADPRSGEVFDYFGGLNDLKAGRVAFIGDPLTRIAEDHLRILRFFRFQARFGQGSPDGQALAACAARANDLMALSRERIADELLKLLALPNPASTVALMIAHGILAPVMPEIVSAEALAALVAHEQNEGVAISPLRRLAALLPADPELGERIGARLKLSKAQRKVLYILGGRSVDDMNQPRALAYHIGREAARDRLLLIGQPTIVLRDWTPPRFPLTGGQLIARGLSAGPSVATILAVIEAQWVDENFPTGDRLNQIVDETLHKLKN